MGALYVLVAVGVRDAGVVGVYSSDAFPYGWSARRGTAEGDARISVEGE